MTFTFNSKTTYLAYRKEWAQRYLYSISEVRIARQAIRDANRAYSKDSKRIGDIWSAYADLRQAREDVTKLLIELDNARQEAGRQMKANTPG